MWWSRRCEEHQGTAADVDTRGEGVAVVEESTCEETGALGEILNNICRHLTFGRGWTGRISLWGILSVEELDRVDTGGEWEHTTGFCYSLGDF